MSHCVRDESAGSDQRKAPAGEPAFQDGLSPGRPPLVFAGRGKRNRTAALRAALQKAEQIYEQNFGVKPQHTMNVTSSSPKQHPGLQAVDYFLWALQRFYEKEEDRFWRFVWPKVRAVHDLDDTREHSFGAIYTPQKPLTLEARAKK